MGRRSGEYYETKALHYLQQQGLKLVIRNFTQKLGEIDLIMLDDATLVFLEVKFRASTSHGHPLETITQSKQKKIKRCAQIFIQQNPSFHHSACRFDAVSLSTKEVRWVKNAFQ